MAGKATDSIPFSDAKSSEFLYLRGQDIYTWIGGTKLDRKENGWMTDLCAAANSG